MVKNITDAAVAALEHLATIYNIPLEDAYYQIDNKQRGPLVSMWFIIVTNSLDEENYYLKEMNGVRLAIEKPAAEFLIDAIIDYRAGMSHSKHLYDRVPFSRNRPVWPKGFVFLDQSFSIDPVSTW